MTFHTGKWLPTTKYATQVILEYFTGCDNYFRDRPVHFIEWIPSAQGLPCSICSSFLCGFWIDALSNLNFIIGRTTSRITAPKVYGILAIFFLIILESSTPPAYVRFKTNADENEIIKGKHTRWLGLATWPNSQGRRRLLSRSTRYSVSDLWYHRPAQKQQ